MKYSLAVISSTESDSLAHYVDTTIDYSTCMQYHILPDICQVKMLTWSQFVNKLCITHNISSQQTF